MIHLALALLVALAGVLLALFLEPRPVLVPARRRPSTRRRNPVLPAPRWRGEWRGFHFP